MTSISTQGQDLDSELKPRQRKTVTLSDDAIDLGERLARDENRNFSNYIETLILRDAGRAPAKMIAKPAGARA
jgi:hypothetical protein